MGTIHINTDLLRQLGQLFVQLDDQINNSIKPQIQSHTSQLENDWQGVSRQRYEQMFQEWRTTVEQLAARGQDIGRHLQDTATRLEQADQSL